MAGLEQEAIHLALVDRAYGGFEVRLARQDHADGVRPLLAHFGEELAAGHARHAFVGDDHVDLVAREDHQTFRAESAVKISNCERSRLRTSAEVRFGSSSTSSSLLFSIKFTFVQSAFWITVVYASRHSLQRSRRPWAARYSRFRPRSAERTSAMSEAVDESVRAMHDAGEAEFQVRRLRRILADRRSLRRSCWAGPTSRPDRRPHRCALAWSSRRSICCRFSKRSPTYPRTPRVLSGMPMAKTPACRCRCSMPARNAAATWSGLEMLGNGNAMRGPWPWTCCAATAHPCCKPSTAGGSQSENSLAQCLR